jgi:phenylpropionate dioxygenase-like ring-hydroxylating dioxygenase large terminal subunit
MVTMPSLVGPGWVDGRIYTDEDIFRLERERIFRRTWMYAAHESEIPTPGDYQRREISGEPVIVLRDRDGHVRALLNRCRHRGNLVCQYTSGNAQFFRCQYHGWTYSNRGELVGVPYPKSYGADFDRSRMGLSELPKVESYRGFIFVSFSADIPALRDYLGPAADMIDIFVDQSPIGKIRVRSGVQRSEYRGNWKFIGMDGYHTNFVHKSVELLQHPAPARREQEQEQRRPPDLTSRELGKSPDKLGNKTYDFGNGHVRLDSTSQRLAKADDVLRRLAATPAGQEYIAAMRQRYGEERARLLMCAGDPHVGIFPNLQIIGVHIRVIEPLAADRTVIAQYPATLEGAPDEINERRLRQHEWFFSPAGFGSPDDYEVFERNQAGLAAEQEPMVVLSRGLGSEVSLGERVLQGSYSDEVTQRGQLARWTELMSLGDGEATP